MNEIPVNIRMAARLVAGAIRRIKEKKVEKPLDKDGFPRLIGCTTKGTHYEQVETR